MGFLGFEAFGFREGVYGPLVNYRLGKGGYKWKKWLFLNEMSLQKFLAATRLGTKWLLGGSYENLWGLGFQWHKAVWCWNLIISADQGVWTK